MKKIILPQSNSFIYNGYFDVDKKCINIIIEDIKFDLREILNNCNQDLYSFTLNELILNR